jgi:phosphate starvation-inducible protein PhoH
MIKFEEERRNQKKLEEKEKKIEKKKERREDQEEEIRIRTEECRDEIDRIEEKDLSAKGRGQFRYF